MPRLSLSVRIWRALAPTFRYWMETEVHVYAFSISSGILLSFFPFLIVMLSLCRYVFKWRAGVNAVYFALDDYFPDAFGHFLRRNFEATIESHGQVQLISLVLLFFTATGIFEPLEVALNRAWKCSGNRSYIKNQLIGLGLIFACGGLMLISTIFTTPNNRFLKEIAGANAASIANVIGLVAFKLAAVPLLMLLLFLIYWLLPNCKIEPSRIVPAAIGVGFLLEILKYVNLLTWPYLRAKLSVEYGPFYYTVTIILWGFLAAMVVLAGAEWTARRSPSDRSVLSS
jgi:YihY family inner membrane protein